MLLPQLTDLGLTEEEARMYTALLELGGGYVSVLAKHAGMHRVSAYHTLDNLVEKRLATRVSKNRAKFYAPEHPQTLVNLQKARLATADHLLPQLLSITNSLAAKPAIRYFEGREGVQHVLDLTLESKEELLVCTDLAAWMQAMPEYCLHYTTTLRQKKRRMRILTPFKAAAQDFMMQHYPTETDKLYCEIFHVNASSFPISNHIIILEDQVAILQFDGANSMGVLMESGPFATSMRSLFHLGWLGGTILIAR